jgi:hypothetical protein
MIIIFNMTNVLNLYKYSVLEMDLFALSDKREERFHTIGTVRGS